MIERNHTMHKCPVCEEWYGISPTDIDFIHKCIKSDGTRLTEDGTTHPERIPSRITLNVESSAFPMSGMNTRQPDKKLSKSDIEDIIFTAINVDTYIPFE